ncbi:hypothetical protein [Paenibacillus sp. JJ-223]|uniref:hypothetical protein n=1 Tax=Paenibacillus sp. JJ-223 TaxID=2905647 RepID=UPI001F462665|nr:hypothetical protein [Paenibacillus sp. JJ-223]CAH1226461.1 hypothetical protein PAECIP111890_05936 [Paenibacillus sp. JJ-223]
MRVVEHPEERRRFNDILDAEDTRFIVRKYGKTAVNDILRACEIAKPKVPSTCDWCGEGQLCLYEPTVSVPLT